MTKEQDITEEQDHNSKEDVYKKICNAVLKLEVSNGHLKWTVSQISREADVTRSLIYYYFGKEKEVILQEAFRFVVEQLYATSPGEIKLGLSERMKKVLTVTKELPYMFILYCLERNKDSEIGEIIRKAEAEVMKRFQRDFPGLDEDQRLSIYLLELGAIAYGLGPEKAHKFFNEEHLKTII